MKTILTIGAIAAGVFLLFSRNGSAAGGGVSLSNVPNRTLIYGRDGVAYVTAPRPATSLELYASGGTINLSNSAQIIRPAGALDSIMAGAW